MSDASRQQDWTKPAAIANPKGGFFKDKVEQGRYGPIFPKTPACYGFSIIAKLIPGGEEACYKHAKTIEEAVAKDPNCLAVLKLHYLRWQVFEINGKVPTSSIRASSTQTSTSTPRMLLLSSRPTGILYCLRIPRRLPQRLEDQAEREFPSSSSATTIARASSNTGNIPM